ncbi:MAG: hypothetical protein COC23_06495 [Hyphomicrobiales bacterium]|nr:YcaQ family DNA glycosylase [Ahrensia sp. AH-315-G08]PCH45578.1 MAG: hypothetical protein COC23_06495 [Hyphomicrobiales bacterium]
MRLTNKQARHVILHLQGMTMEPHLRLDDAALLDVIRQLGFVQMDSIQWVERAHHMILYARNQTYRPKQLKRLMEKNRELFEHWTHDASLIPSEFYPYWRHRFARKRNRMEVNFTKWQGPGYRDQCHELEQRIRNDGPLMSKDLEREKTGKQEMWQWHDGKAALEFLWHTGALCVSARVSGFQKVYDVPENAVPPHHFDQRVSASEFKDWACRSALDRLGFAAAGDIARYWDLVSPAEAKAWVEDQLARGKILEVIIEAVRGEVDRQMVARRDIGQLIDNLPPLPKRARALSPFDPVIRDRKRLQWLFGFEYRIEIYVPEEKRRWGYYVFPLLEGDKLVGRIDMRANRKEDQLQVKRLWLEGNAKLSAARKARIESEMLRQARLANVKSVVWLDGALEECST